MSDVDATIGIAEIIKKNDDDLWKHFMKFTNHKDVSKVIGDNKILLYPNNLTW